jgi:hypothetical protein
MSRTLAVAAIVTAPVGPFLFFLEAAHRRRASIRGSQGDEQPFVEAARVVTNQRRREHGVSNWGSALSMYRCEAEGPFIPPWMQWSAGSMAVFDALYRRRRATDAMLYAFDPARLILQAVYSQMPSILRWHNASSNSTPSARALRWLLPEVGTSLPC